MNEDMSFTNSGLTNIVKTKPAPVPLKEFSLVSYLPHQKVPEAGSEPVATIEKDHGSGLIEPHSGAILVRLFCWERWAGMKVRRAIAILDDLPTGNPVE